MSKSVIRSAKPYWIYLILTGKKKVEVGKNFPKSKDWNRIVEMYCSKDMRSFKRIPEKDREWMRKYLGKIACRFVCDRIDTYQYGNMDYPTPAYDGDKSVCEVGDGYWITFDELCATCLDYAELEKYGKGAPLYGWHISDLVIYDKPRELGEFRTTGLCFNIYNLECTTDIWGDYHFHCYQNSLCRACKYLDEFGDCGKTSHSLTRPPQSWCYVEV